MDRRRFQKNLIARHDNNIDCFESILIEEDFLEVASAFSNSAGGIIYIGLSNNYKVVGCHVDVEESKLHQYLTLLSQNEHIAYNIIEVDHYRIIEVIVGKTETLTGFGSDLKCFYRYNKDNVRFGKIIESLSVLTEHHVFVEDELIEKVFLVILDAGSINVSAIYNKIYALKKDVDLALIDLLFVKAVEYTIADGIVMYQVSQK